MGTEDPDCKEEIGRNMSPRSRKKKRSDQIRIPLLQERDIEAEVISFYKGLLGTTASTSLSVNLVIIRCGNVLTQSQRLELIKPVTAHEIYTALHSIGDSKAPGADGFSSLFFKSAWNVIGHDFIMAIQDFFRTVRGAVCFRSRPFIHDNSLLAQEIIRGYGRRNISARCMIKLDLQKAFDSVNWVFVEDLLRKLGFPAMFVGWIMTCLTTVSYQINLNGRLTYPFHGGKGIRQGDPMSPFLFVICMEYLNRVLKATPSSSLYRFHPRCDKLKISHLVFADDLLLFSKGTFNSVKALLDRFDIFSRTLGLIANRNKSEIYTAGVREEVKASILAFSQLKEGKLPFRYLGIPLNAKRLSIIQYQPLLDKMLGRINHWTSKMLSYGGRIQLIQSKVMKAVESLCRKFLWTGQAGDSKGALVAWDSICRTKGEGGIGLLHLPSWNKVSFLKLLWAINQKSDKLWIKWLHEYYVKSADVMNMLVPSDASYFFKKALKCRVLVRSSVEWRGMEVNGKFDKLIAYNIVRYPISKVAWKDFLMNNRATPRAKFCLWLAL
ncbi:hypothetical protein OROGR_006125 [Orobanche gracilis]